MKNNNCTWKKAFDYKEKKYYPCLRLFCFLEIIKNVLQLLGLFSFLD